MPGSRQRWSVASTFLGRARVLSRYKWYARDGATRGWRRTPYACTSCRPGPTTLEQGIAPAHDLSTLRCQRSILAGVHSVLRGTLKLRNHSFLGSGRMDNLLKAHT